MCGIVGMIGRPAAAEDLQVTIIRMRDALRHRGPDDAGTWTDPKTGLALGHRRLSILDLSPAGHQPMHSASGRYVIVFNGEIYNFGDLRSNLDACGCRFQGRSDTEVMLAAFEHWGLVASLRRFSGMFAFALWDRQRQELHLARDRMGEKPLYYGWLGSTFVFGSELKALRKHPAWHGRIDSRAVAGLLRYGYVPTPLSIHTDIYKLPPATVLSLPLGRAATRSAVSPQVSTDRRSEIAPQPYWSLYEAAVNGLRNPIADPTEAVEALSERLSTSVRQQMVSDVPLGAFLSGGIDSSTVVAVMQQLSDRPVKTFTIGFHEPDFNEAEHAKAIARHLGTEHTELFVSAHDALAVVPLLPEMYDEPFADPSQIPTFLVSKMAREHVTVALSGDGGDELFAGYNRYLWTDRLWRRMHGIPFGLRAALGRTIQAVPPSRWNRVLKGVERHLLRRTHVTPNSGYKLHKMGLLAQQRKIGDAYRQLLSYWENPLAAALGTEEPASHVGSRALALTQQTTFIDQAMLWDQASYLLDDNLTKVDRASMAVGLETRLPLLDHKVVELAWRIPIETRISGGQTKWPLRQVLYNHVPKGLIERPKMGFSVPVGEWLRHPLRPWATELLENEPLITSCGLRQDTLRTVWKEHLKGRRDRSLALWAALSLLAWHHRLAN